MFDDLKGKLVMVRCDRAGVHFGTLVDVKTATDGFDIKLVKSRRVYSWAGAFTLSELSQLGPNKEGSKISIEIPEIYIRGIEIIPMTQQAHTKLAQFEFKI